ASGLSSSAALVVGTGLAIALANGIATEPLDFADRMARGERYVGTHGGGMDQAICMLGRHDHAVRIDFAPLEARAIAVPSDWRFVIANSLVLADKSGATRDAYNSRRASCRTALAAIANELGLANATYPSLVASRASDELVAIAGRVLDRTTA